jgi:hypothetical protein
MIVIGFTGPIGHGKSTFSAALHKLEPSHVHIESSMIIAEIADTLHASLEKIPERDDLDSINNWLRMLPVILLQQLKVKCSFSQIMLDPERVKRHPIEYEKLFLHIDNLTHNPKLLQQKITLDNKEAYRPFLQWLGGYLIRSVDSGIWYKEIVRRVQKASQKGVKLCTVGGLRYPNDATILRGVDALIVKVYRPGHLQYDALDPTERERDNIKPDVTVVSDGGIEEVTLCAKCFMDDLKNDQLKKTYYTSHC